MSLNEDDFINQFIKHLSFDKLVTIPPGDDCAELSLGPTKLLLAVDQLSADIHYLKATTPPIRIGHKLLARNLSDIAAMGGVPNYALMTIALTEDHSDEFLTEMSDGVRLLAEQHDVQIIGGDFGKAKTDHFTLTIIGHAKYTAIRRNNA